MSAAVIERPATAAKKVAKNVTLPLTAGLEVSTAVRTSDGPGALPDAETKGLAVAYVPSFDERAILDLGVVSAITSACLEAVGGLQERNHIPRLVCTSMRHAERLLSGLNDATRGEQFGPDFEPLFDEARGLVELFNESCITEYGEALGGGFHFIFCRDDISSMLWGIRCAIDAMLKIVDPDRASKGEAK